MKKAIITLMILFLAGYSLAAERLTYKVNQKTGKDDLVTHYDNYSSLTKIGTGAGNLPTWMGGAWPGGGSGSVSSVFGRTGVVAAQLGDYAAAQVSYTHPTYTTVGAALDQLLYVAPSITSHTNRITYGPTTPFNQTVSGTASSQSIEIGNTVSRVELFWALNKTVTTQSYNNGIGSIDAALRAYDHTGQSFTTSRTYTLTVGDGTNTDTTPTTGITFYARRHWGTSANASLTSAQILALTSNEFSTTHTKSGVVYNCTGGLYPYFAYPTSWGLPTAVKVGGLAFSDFSCATVSHTNASGYTQNYYTCRFNSLQTGSAITVDWD